MKTTSKAVNEALKPLGMEIVRGEGYYYFLSLGKEEDHPINWGIEQGVYGGSPRITDQTVEEWVRDGIGKIEEAFEWQGRKDEFKAWMAARGFKKNPGRAR